MTGGPDGMMTWGQRGMMGSGGMGPWMMGGSLEKMCRAMASVVVWRRQKDGTLKIAVDTFNSDGLGF